MPICQSFKIAKLMLCILSGLQYDFGTQYRQAAMAPAHLCNFTNSLLLSCTKSMKVNEGSDQTLDLKKALTIGSATIRCTFCTNSLLYTPIIEKIM